MDGRGKIDRRSAIQKIGSTAAAAGAIGIIPKPTTAAEQTTTTSETPSADATASSSRTRLEITERYGAKINYRIKVQTTNMRNAYSIDPADNIERYNNVSVADGTLNGGTDAYDFPRQILSIRLDNEDQAGNVEIVCSGGFGYTGPAAVSIQALRSRAVGCGYGFSTTGSVRTPGDGSLEGDDNSGDGNVNGGFDHWDTTGRLKELYVAIRGQNQAIFFDRNIGDRW